MKEFPILVKNFAGGSIYRIESGEYEVWMDLNGKGNIHPKDEDFGVWAWSCYTFERAIQIANDIEMGVRKITPMVEG